MYTCKNHFTKRLTETVLLSLTHLKSLIRFNQLSDYAISYEAYDVIKITVALLFPKSLYKIYKNFWLYIDTFEWFQIRWSDLIIKWIDAHRLNLFWPLVQSQLDADN